MIALAGVLGFKNPVYAISNLPVAVRWWATTEPDRIPAERQNEGYISALIPEYAVYQTALLHTYFIWPVRREVPWHP
jgi:hypothetical protein